MTLEEMNWLDGKLRKCPQISAMDDAENEHFEADAIVHALHDIEESTKVIYQKLVPKLMESDISCEERYSLLEDIMEEFRHVAYHIADPKTFRMAMP